MNALPSYAPKHPTKCDFLVDHYYTFIAELFEGRIHEANMLTCKPVDRWPGCPPMSEREQAEYEDRQRHLYAIGWMQK